MTTARNLHCPARATTRFSALREFHVDHGQGRVVAVLFRVAVDDHHHEAGRRDQRRGDGRTQRDIGDLE